MSNLIPREWLSNLNSIIKFDFVITLIKYLKIIVGIKHLYTDPVNEHITNWRTPRHV